MAIVAAAGERHDLYHNFINPSRSLLVWSLEDSAMLPRPEEQRRNTRHLMRRAADVVFGSPERRLRCEIRDMSDGGARLAVSGSIKELPRTLTLVLFHDASVQRDCQVIWADGRSVGVQFTSDWYGMKSDANQIRG
jgi:hypothetical protein